MQTNELTEAELDAHVKDACAVPATPKKDVEDAVWKQVNKRLDRKHGEKTIALAAPRRLWRWWLAASTVAAALLIATLVAFRGDPSWDMAAAPKTAAAREASKTSPMLTTSLEKQRPDSASQSDPELVPLPIEAPKAVFIGTPAAPPDGVRLAPNLSENARSREIGDAPEADTPLPTPARSFAQVQLYTRKAQVRVTDPVLTPPVLGDAEYQKSVSPPVRSIETSPVKAPEDRTDRAEDFGEITSDTVLIPPPISTTEPARKLNMDRIEEGSKAKPSDRPAVITEPVSATSPAKVKNWTETEGTDARGNKDIEDLRVRAAELQRKIDEAEAATRRGPVPPNPYANLQPIKPNVPVLTGGVQDDNVDFEKFQNFLRQTSAPEAIKQDISERVMIEIADVQGLPLTNADVRIISNGRTIHKARTYANGVALFFPRVVGVDPQSREFRVEVVPPPGCNGQTVAQDFRGRSGTWRVQVPYARSQNATKLDILFCLDCTGSMADEIERIQKTLQMMVAKFNALPGKPQTRWGLVQYRDRGDQYVTQVHDFTEDVSTFQKRLDACRADAGGDEPESLNEALDKSVEGVSWDRNDAIRLVFVVGDAPPHMNYQNDVKYTESMAKAQRRAIKIYPLAASGLNKTGEVIFRQLAQFTLARFLFISYGGSTSHEVSNPGQSNNLDDLIVHVVASEVNARATAVCAPFQIEDPERWQK